MLIKPFSILLYPIGISRLTLEACKISNGSSFGLLENFGKNLIFTSSTSTKGNVEDIMKGGFE